VFVQQQDKRFLFQLESNEREEDRGQNVTSQSRVGGH
jgi:hypothetical protein